MKKVSTFTRIRRKLKLVKDLTWGNIRLFFNPFCRKSFSQCGEDLIVKHVFDALGILRPSYIDIGAHHPFRHSNTALFYLLGSTGINIEPDPDLFRKFPKRRPHDKNLNIGISSEEGLLEFFVMKNPTLNTFSREKAENYEKEQGVSISETKLIKVCTLASVLENYGNGKFWDFMSLDVEGFEMPILKSIDWEEFSPKVICCETISFSDCGKGKKDHTIIDFLVSKGFMVYADTSVNTIFVKKDIWQA
jgi:FkbM family methyltransferase